MSLQDPIADMICSIKNAQAVGKKTVTFPASKLKLAIAQVLKDEGYIADFSTQQEGVKSQVAIELKYYENRPVIAAMKRVSRPGLRVYKACDDLPKVMGGLGVAIVSTSMGIMSDRKARQHGQGGEVICTVC